QAETPAPEKVTLTLRDVSFRYPDQPINALNALSLQANPGEHVRNNVWCTFSTRDYAMAVCNLTGNKKITQQRYATLQGATAFINYLYAHP
ncbi:hypothetical protein MJM04_27770, partial [Salmonella enterica subsp. enterica serovar Cerro]|nr:hypothetical protein [Salmonella enterica subsp. enterica serovar Cerro]